ncbi:MAG: O-antigen ligase family protein [Candidatus Omnitrophota bacterium]
MFNILLIFIFLRPFISSVAYPLENSIYSVLLFLFLVSYLFLKKFELNKLQRIKYPLIFFLLSLIISFIFSSSKLNSSLRIFDYILGLLLFFSMFSISAENKIRVIQTIILSGLVVSFLAIYQYFFGFQHLSAYIAKKGIDNSFIIDCVNQKRVFFPFMTPNILSGFLALSIVFIPVIKHKIKWLFFLTMFIALILTRSLGGILSIILAIIILNFIQRKLFRRYYYLIVIFILSLVSIFILRQFSLKEQFLPLFSFLSRIEYWKETIDIIKLHPFTGIGLGNLNLSMSRYAHNLYLQLWAETGILGLFSFLWLVGAVLKYNIKYIKDFGCNYINLNILLLVAVILFLIDNFISFSFFLPEVSFIWWIILGLSI